MFYTPSSTFLSTTASLSSPVLTKQHSFNSMKITFYISYILLLTTGTITFIEALRSPKAEVRHIMNIETCISIVAAYFYSLFIAKIQEAEKENKPLDYGVINSMRYTDWFITTPLMLLVLMMVLGYHNKQNIHIWSYFIVIGLNFAMLLIGYLGEIAVVDKYLAVFLGFVFFFGVFGVIWMLYFNDKINTINVFVYGAFALFWSIYGLVYIADEYTKNVAFNILDVIAKCFVGIFFWMYFTGILVY